MIQDWYHQQSDDLLSSFLNVYNPTGAERMHDFLLLLSWIKLTTLSLFPTATPDSGLINNNANSTFDFVPGKTYRLRLINMSAFSTFFFSIDGHDMDVIEVDGVCSYSHIISLLIVLYCQK